MPEDEAYTLIARDRQGEISAEGDFISNGLVAALRLDDVKASALLAATWQVTTSAGTVLFESA